MMYPFMTLDDDTEIVHSMHSGGCMKVYIERPDGMMAFPMSPAGFPMMSGKAILDSPRMTLPASRA